MWRWTTRLLIVFLVLAALCSSLLFAPPALPASGAELVVPEDGHDDVVPACSLASDGRLLLASKA